METSGTVFPNPWCEARDAALDSASAPGLLFLDTENVPVGTCSRQCVWTHRPGALVFTVGLEQEGWISSWSSFSSLVLFLLLNLDLSSAFNSSLNHVDQTFSCVDPVSGAELTCRQCPPGKYLLSRCTSERQRNMVETSRCSAEKDCDCECKPGYYYKQRAGMCVRWSECTTGQGVVQKGTPSENTVCAPCSNGTFSDQVSSESVCSPHRICSGPEEKTVVKGNSWHDAVCVSCSQARGKSRRPS
ncbi:hypothetical protein WMY93_019040 [Mugilogobius chulae]|uniref:TNFR-Cys domain-containing protein n=1 Tax=Mugilogobius chulae TaxID=88201 RepID=A0AAW0NP23_9GOBI